MDDNMEPALRIGAVVVSYADPDVCITDQRLARLLVVLDELDRSVAGLEGLTQKELSDLVSSAILTCGFVNPVEATNAIAEVLHTIESHGSLEWS